MKRRERVSGSFVIPRCTGDEGLEISEVHILLLENATTDIMFKVLIEANSKKVEKAIQEAAEQIHNKKECDVGHSV